MDTDRHLRVTVVICAYTEKRWDLLSTAISSVAAQTVPPVELLVCVDHNRGLYERLGRWLASKDLEFSFEVKVLENRFPGRLGSARNSALEVARGDVVAFLDDDARADSRWLEMLLRVFEEEDVVVVGGRPVADYGGPRPPWLPEEFNWVFGCHYCGLPETRAVVRHLIGASMAARTDLLREIKGFHSDDHDDMDLSHRSTKARPGTSVIYEPAAVVHHYVSPERLTWSYFWRRCFWVNFGKVRAFRDMGDAGSITAELQFVYLVIGRHVPRHLLSVLRGDVWGAARAAVIFAGLALGAAGNVWGKVHLRLRPNEVVLTQGLP